MSLGLLTRTSCQFCGLCYRTLDDLIAHIEYSHIPLITSLKMAQKQNSCGSSNQERYTPLSAVCRLFTTPYDPTPCEQEGPIRLTFDHCRRFRSEYRCAGSDRDISPCPIDGCRMEIESNDDWKVHLQLVHGVTERVDLQDDLHEAQGTRSSVIDQRVHRCPQCRKFFKTSSRLLEHTEKRHKKTDSSKPSDVVVKIEEDEDLYQAVSPVIHEEQCANVKKIEEKSEEISQHHYETQTPKVIKEEPPSEQMFTGTPTSGHLLRQRLMQHRRTLMEDEKNEMKFYNQWQ